MRAGHLTPNPGLDATISPQPSAAHQRCVGVVDGVEAEAVPERQVVGVVDPVRCAQHKCTIELEAGGGADGKAATEWRRVHHHRLLREG